MSVKVYLMWNSQMLIDGDGDAIAATSMLEASNIVVLRVTCSLLFKYHPHILILWNI